MAKIKINLQKLKQWRYILRHQVLTRQNILLIGASLLAISWIWSAIGAMSQNYQLQRKLDDKMRQEKIIELEMLNLEYEQKYYQSREYQELAVRRKLNLALPGEKVLIMDEYSDWVKQKEAEVAQRPAIDTARPSNFRQWMDFLFGGRYQTRTR